MPSNEPRREVEARKFFRRCLESEDGSTRLKIALRMYPIVMKELVNNIKGHGEYTNSETIEKDSYLREKMPQKHFMSYKELEDAFYAKQMKGVARPNINQIKKNQGSRKVESVSEKAFRTIRGNVDNSKADVTIESAINELSALPGIGPATASLLLSYAAPDKIAFASDQVLDIMNPDVLRDYKLIEIIDSNRALRLAVKTLNSQKDSGEDWSVEKLGMTLFVLGKIHSNKPKDCHKLYDTLMADLEGLERNLGRREKAIQDVDNPLKAIKT